MSTAGHGDEGQPTSAGGTLGDLLYADRSSPPVPETEWVGLVQSVAAEAQQFTSLLPEYTKNPGFFRRRLQTETAQRIFTNAQDKFFLPARADGGSRELRLQLNREPLAPARPPTP